MEYNAGDINKLHLSKIKAKNIEQKKKTSSIGYVSMTIVAFVGGISYEVQLENGLYRMVGSKAFTQIGRATATSRIME